MSPLSINRLKVGLGMVLGFSIGAACRYLDLPSPAPPLIAGAMLVLAMTVGYAMADKWLVGREARHKAYCGGPDGATKSGPAP